jgi:hypothetical protein
MLLSTKINLLKNRCKDSDSSYVEGKSGQYNKWNKIKLNKIRQQAVATLEKKRKKEDDDALRCMVQTSSRKQMRRNDIIFEPTERQAKLPSAQPAVNSTNFKNPIM